MNLVITYSMTGIWNFNQITDVLYKKMQILLENRIIFYVIPKEWNTTKSGLIETISNVLNLKLIDLFRVQLDPTKSKVIGRVCQTSTSPYTLMDLLNLIKDKMNLPHLQYLGDLDSSIQRVAIIVGNTISPEALKLANRLNIDTIIGDHFTFETKRIAEEFYLNLIDTTLNIANLGLLKLSQSLQMEQPKIEFTFLNLNPSLKIF